MPTKKNKLDPPDAITTALQQQHITARTLAAKLKEELSATQTKLLKDADRLSGTTIEVIDWGTRQRARIDAHRLRGDYPAEQSKVSIDSRVELPPEISEMIDLITAPKQSKD
jgi:hypothetical protein